VQFPVCDGNDLPRAKCDRRAIPRDDERTGENESTDRVEMPMPAFARSGVELLRFDLGVTVGLKLCFKLALVPVRETRYTSVPAGRAKAPGKGMDFNPFPMWWRGALLSHK